MKKYISLMFLFSIIFFSYVRSENINPLTFIENIIDESKPALLKRDDNFLEKIMEKYIDFNEVALWIVGKKLWFNSNDFEKSKFISELKTLMLKTYSKTAYNYITYDIEFIKPNSFEENEFFKNKRVQVSSVIKKNDRNINISYRLIKHSNSWLVFDVIIDGVSILKSLRVQYSDIARQQGLIACINAIEKNNNK